MLTHENLIAAGFRRFPSSQNLNKGPLYQKRVEREDGRALYFINITENVDLIERHPEMAGNYQWSTEVHLYLDDEGAKGTCITYLIRQATTVDEVERFYQRSFVALGCVPDPHND